MLRDADVTYRRELLLWQASSVVHWFPHAAIEARAFARHYPNEAARRSALESGFTDEQWQAIKRGR
jgi:hypothetical protein